MPDAVAALSGGTLRLEPLGSARIADAMRLSIEAGWNQVPADWAWMLAHGDSFGVLTAQDRLVASGLTVNFPDGGFGWISMILVTSEYRRRGIATALMQQCVEALRQRGLVAALDASPQGREVYLPLGFIDGRVNIRLRGTVRSAAPVASMEIRAVTEADLASIVEYDRIAAGARRDGLLTHLFSRLPRGAFVAKRDGKLRGYVLARDGRTCAQIGPLVADSDEAAIALLHCAGTAIGREVCLDLGEQHSVAQEWLRDQGFVPATTFVRMTQHRARPSDDLARIYAIAGPELG